MTKVVGESYYNNIMKYNKNIKYPQNKTEKETNKFFTEEKSTLDAPSDPSGIETKTPAIKFFKILWLKKSELGALIVFFILLIILGIDRLISGRIHIWIDIIYVGGYIFFTFAQFVNKKFITLADVISSLLQALFWPTLFCFKYAMRLENKESLYRIILYVNKTEKNNKEVSYYE